MHTDQETFDHIVACLRKQGRKSENDDGCAYRGHSGLKCASGWCIDDEHYRSYFEGKMASFDVVAEAIEASGWSSDVAWDLQAVHDGADPLDWEKGFRTVAEECGLTYTPPEQTCEN